MDERKNVVWRSLLKASDRLSSGYVNRWSPNVVI